MPASFLTEIQQDEVYETILEELRKKMPNLVAPKTPSVHEDEEQKRLSPHLLAINDDNDTDNEDDDDDDDDVSIDDGVSSSRSSDNNPRSFHEDYDTDIET
ncbi:unnamed protein product, partial [Rotaria magnacalcarata]